eukprot:PhF_6_TR36539/c0_g1_i1/m.53886
METSITGAFTTIDENNSQSQLAPDHLIRTHVHSIPRTFQGRIKVLQNLSFFVDLCISSPQQTQRAYYYRNLVNNVLTKTLESETFYNRCRLAHPISDKENISRLLQHWCDFLTNQDHFDPRAHTSETETTLTNLTDSSAAVESAMNAAKFRPPWFRGLTRLQRWNVVFVPQFFVDSFITLLSIVCTVMSPFDAKLIALSVALFVMVIFRIGAAWATWEADQTAERHFEFIEELVLTRVREETWKYEGASMSSTNPPTIPGDQNDTLRGNMSVPPSGLVLLPTQTGNIITAPADLVTSHTLMFAVETAEGKVVLWNQRCQEVTGFDSSLVIGKPTWTFLADEASKEIVNQALIHTVTNQIVVFLSDNVIEVEIVLSSWIMIGTPNVIVFFGQTNTSGSGVNDVTANILRYIKFISEDNGVSSELRPSLDPQHIMTTINRWSRFVVFDLPSEIGLIIDSMRNACKSQHILLSYDVDTNMPTMIVWNGEVLMQLVRRAITNALRFTPPRGTIDVQILRQKESTIQLRIRNSTNNPISSQMLRDEIDEGNYLMPLVVRLEEYGARFFCECDQTCSTLVANIPCIPPDIQRNSTNAFSVSDSTAVAERLHVIVLENNRIFCSVISHYLWSKGYAMTRCRNVLDVIHAVEEKKADVLFYDMDKDFEIGNADHVKMKCEELNVVFVPTFMARSEVGRLDIVQKSAFRVEKPFIINQLQVVLANVGSKVKESQQRDDQVQFMKTLFTEYKSCAWECGPLIGRGTYGEVYVATSVLTQGRMAVKMIPIDRDDPEIKEKTEELLNEITILRTMDHPNVIHYFCCERASDTVNIFMEYANGGTILDLIQKRSLSISRLSRILKEVLKALIYIHDLGIIHRDIKAANILLSNNCIKLADFGSATQLKNGVATGTKGSVRWMAPEVMRGKEPYTQACDIWSVGCLMLELVTRQQPFTHISKSQAGVFTHIANLTNESYVDYGYTCTYPHEDSFLAACLTIDPTMRASARTLLLHPFLNRSAAAANTSSAAGSAIGTGERGGSRSSGLVMQTWSDSDASMDHGHADGDSRTPRGGAIPLAQMMQMIKDDDAGRSEIK